jgi:Eukaryotic translation initiation factor 3 subunit 7 (eIF-3).
VAYKYRKWDLGEGIGLVARCEHDGVLASPNGDLQFLNIKALNEWDSKLSGGEWVEGKEAMMWQKRLSCASLGQIL